MCKAVTLTISLELFPRIGKLRLNDVKTLDRGLSLINQDWTLFCLVV